MPVVCWIIQIWLLCLFLRVILSWIPFNRSRGVMGKISELTYVVTEPVIGPVRRALPMLRFGNMGFDLSPIVVILVVQLIHTQVLHC